MRLTSVSPTDRRLGRPWTLCALLLLAALLAPTPVRAEDPPADGEPKTEEKEDGAKQADAPLEAKPLLPQILADPKAFKDIVEAGRQYFDLDEEQWRGRSAFVAELERHAAEGRHFLKDLPALRWLVSQARSFRPPLSNRKWQRANGITEAKSLPGTLYWLKSEDFTITFSAPKKYPKSKDLRSKHPRIDPLPLLLTMHRKGDYTGQRYPGEALMKRLYGDKKLWGSLFEEWLILAPIAAAGNFVGKDGMLRREVFQDPFSVFWKHYHVDFDRVLLEGEEHAFTAACSMPVFFAGIVLRGKKWKLTDEQKALVQNLASVPVYVVDNAELAAQLEEAGHPNVTKGIANVTLLKWMNAQHRKAPTSFSWNAAHHDQVLPYWINLDAPNWSATQRSLKVEVLDTPEHPNTVQVEARGINDMSFFLNDDIVDLDRKVRVVINGHVEYDALIGVQDKRMEKLGRDFDFLFNREPLRIRQSMYFGWLTPARIVRVNVRAPIKKEPKKAETPAATGPVASAEEEVVAERLMYKARDLIRRGSTERAKQILQKILDMPPNKQTADAAKLIKEL